jgi:hypothetical protein
MDSSQWEIATMTPQSTGRSAVSQSSLYGQNFCLWLETSVNQLRQEELSEVDWPHLIAELESMGRSERQALQSNLQVVLMHLLKYRFQPDKRSNSWRFILLEHRDRLEVALEDSPSLRP